VTAAEFSRTALRVAKEAAASIDFVQLDLRHGLPFAPGRYTAVVANLCLHYFSWAQTVEILGQVRACLKPGGALLARFNSTNDSNFGAEGYPQVEPNAFWVDGMYKRYFDLEGLKKLFGEEWQVLGREEMAIHRYGAPKVLWEITATLKT
jgi:SAM-dependent methyltransferase